MDRKQKRTVLLAMLFVVVCGLAYVVLRMGTGKTAGLVLEPKTEMQVSEPKDGLPQEETAGEAESGKDDFAEATPAAKSFTSRKLPMWYWPSIPRPTEPCMIPPAFPISILLPRPISVTLPIWEKCWNVA